MPNIHSVVTLRVKTGAVFSSVIGIFPHSVTADKAFDTSD